MLWFFSDSACVYSMKACRIPGLRKSPHKKGGYAFSRYFSDGEALGDARKVELPQEIMSTPMKKS